MRRTLRNYFQALKLFQLIFLEKFNVFLIVISTRALFFHPLSPFLIVMIVVFHSPKMPLVIKTVRYIKSNTFLNIFSLFLSIWLQFLFPWFMYIGQNVIVCVLDFIANLVVISELSSQFIPFIPRFTWLDSFLLYSTDFEESFTF